MTDTDTKSLILWKSSLGFTSTNKEKEFFEETQPFNNYVIGDDIFADSIPPAFEESANTIQFTSSVSGTLDVTGTVCRLENVELTLIPQSDSDSTSGAWTAKDNTGNIILTDSIQFNTNQVGSSQPYEYRLYNGDVRITPAEGSWVFDVKSGIVKFYSEYASPITSLKITCYKYVGHKGYKSVILDTSTAFSEGLKHAVYFDENTASDLTGNSTVRLHGDITPTLDADGLNLVRADNQYADMGTTRFGESFTISVWVNVHSYYTWQRIFNFSTDVGTNHINLGEWAALRKLSAQVYENGTILLHNVSNIPYNTNEWMYITFVSNTSSGYSIYINGENANISATTPNGATFPSIKDRNKSWIGNGIDGQIKSLNIWERALSASEISNLYKQGRNYSVVTRRPATANYNQLHLDIHTKTLSIYNNGWNRIKHNVFVQQQQPLTTNVEEGDIWADNANNIVYIRDSTTWKPIGMQQSMLDLKANIHSPQFTGNPKVPAPSGNKSIATVNYVTNRINSIINNASESFDTLGEISEYISNDTEFSNTIDDALQLKADKKDPVFTTSVTFADNMVVDGLDTDAFRTQIDVHNVENTSDSEKPLSQPCQDAFNDKLRKNNPVFSSKTGLTNTHIFSNGKIYNTMFTDSIFRGIPTSSTTRTTDDAIATVGHINNYVGSGLTTLKELSDSIDTSVSGTNLAEYITNNLDLYEQKVANTVPDGRIKGSRLHISTASLKTSANHYSADADDKFFCAINGGKVFKIDKDGIITFKNLRSIRNNLRCINCNIENGISSNNNILIKNRLYISSNDLTISCSLNVDTIKGTITNFKNVPVSNMSSGALSTNQIPTNISVDKISSGVPAKTQLPRGIIIGYNGSQTAPDGWALCNGTNNTPDLRDKFIIADHDARNTAQSVGTNSITLDKDHLPRHNHTGATDYYGQSSSTKIDGDSGISVLTDHGASHVNGTSQTSNQGSSQTYTRLPPYYALVYIMKT